MPSRAVLAADAFKKQSRTSERWLRISEVGIPDLPAFLQEQRAAGYTIVGELGGVVGADGCGSGDMGAEGWWLTGKQLAAAQTAGSPSSAV